MIWVSFVDNAKAVDAVALSPIEICGHEMTIRLKSPDWRKILDAELKLCSDQTLPLCGDKAAVVRGADGEEAEEVERMEVDEHEATFLTSQPSTLRGQMRQYQLEGLNVSVCRLCHAR